MGATVYVLDGILCHYGHGQYINDSFDEYANIRFYVDDEENPTFMVGTCAAIDQARSLPTITEKSTGATKVTLTN